ncbi:MAG: hypothetical protein KC800_13940 [Candidatus Eremiobacteraeota bacterium]|nr:hypothetical protein [Candidatus Eremiobacteraeota bacterium]
MGIWDMQFKAMLKSKETAVASFLAERIMEECIAAGFEAINNVSYPQPYEELIQVRSRTKKGESNTTYTVVVVWDVHPTDPSQKTLTVQVKYNDSTGERSVQFHTVLNENG